MKLLSTLASALLFAGTASAVDFDFFDFEGWYEGGFLSVAADPRPAGSRPGLNMLLKCEEGDGFNGNSCDLVIRGPPGFSLCPDTSTEGTVFTGKIAENQFDADKGVAKFSLLKVICDGMEMANIPIPVPPFSIPYEPTPVTLTMMPGASNRHVKSLNFTIANEEAGQSDTSLFYKLGGGFKSS